MIEACLALKSTQYPAFNISYMFIILFFMFYVRFTLEQSTFNGLLNGAIKRDGEAKQTISILWKGICIHIHIHISLFVLEIVSPDERLSQRGAAEVHWKRKTNRANTLCLVALTSGTLWANKFYDY